MKEVGRVQETRPRARPDRAVCCRPPRPGRGRAGPGRGPGGRGRPRSARPSGAAGWGRDPGRAGLLRECSRAARSPRGRSRATREGISAGRGPVGWDAAVDDRPERTCLPSEGTEKGEGSPGRGVRPRQASAWGGV